MGNFITRAMCVFAALVATAAAGPSRMSFQGQLTDAGGVPLTGSYSVLFRIHLSATAPGDIWSETQTVVADNGLFAVELGDANPLNAAVLSDTSRWLSITINPPGTELSPRTQLCSVPYAHRVSTIDGSTGGTVTGAIQTGSGSALGDGCTSPGLNSFSAGGSSIALGDGSTAIGEANSAQGTWAIAAGGSNNVVGAASQYGSVIGGSNNGVLGDYSTVIGGEGNSANGDHSFAAGWNARADHNNSFVWSSSLGSPVATTANNQFLINGAAVGINTQSPSGSLTVSGASNFTASTSVGGIDALTSHASSLDPSGSAQAVAGRFTSESSPGQDGNRFGIIARGSGYAPFSTASKVVGVRAEAYNYSSGEAIGIESDVTNFSSGTAIGGHFSSTADGISPSYGSMSIAQGDSGAIGAYGKALASGASQPALGGFFTASASGAPTIVYGSLSSSIGSGTSYGSFGYAVGTGTNYAIYGNAIGGSINWAGYFLGNVNVTGTLSKGGGAFRIDHPLDPEHKILQHSFVESPDMMNIYNGNVTTDGQGTAIVTLPAYFDALNSDFRYQLTVIGQFAQAIVGEKISGNRFTIRTDKPNVEVSWQVTGVRQDAWAQANRIQVEMQKPAEQIGKYLHPDAYRKSSELGVDYEQSKPQTAPEVRHADRP